MRGTAVDEDGSAKSGMGVDAKDLDDDGDEDVLVVNLDGESDSFYRNDGAFFSDATAAAGLRAVSRPFTRFGTAWIDFDNDGWLDLYQANGRVGQQAERYGDDVYAEPSLLFRGASDGRFTEVRPRGGTATALVASSRAAAFGDIDNDGGVDIVVVNRDHAPFLLRNVVPNRGHWLTLRVLEPNGRDSLGAEVTATIGARRVMRSRARRLQLSGEQRPARAPRSGCGDDRRECHRALAERHDRVVRRSAGRPHRHAATRAGSPAK